MVDAGALEDMRVELLDGLLVDMSPQGEVHARAINAVMRMCGARMEMLRVQMEDGYAVVATTTVAELLTL